MFKVSVRSDSIMAKLDRIGPHMRETLLPLITDDSHLIRDRAKALAGGSVVKVRSGRYQAAIRDKIYDSGNRLYAKVYSRDPRAGLFEFGGSTPARTILPNRTQALAFMGSAGKVYARVVHRPVVRYAARPVIHAAFDENRGKVEADIRRGGLASLKDLF